jgi:hypothetical protein
MKSLLLLVTLLVASLFVVGIMGVPNDWWSTKKGTQSPDETKQLEEQMQKSFYGSGNK